MKNRKLKAIDLFAGIGGIRIGFESMGFEMVYANDFDKKAAETYRLNYGEIDEEIKPVPLPNVRLSNRTRHIRKGNRFSDFSN